MTAELARLAREGDDEAFALLVDEHRADMRAVAIALLGYTDEAEDAVQDAVLTALTKLSELRDPSAAGPWLRSIVRNNCRSVLRSRRTVPVADPGPLLPPDPGAGPEELLDRAVTRDWVRHAVSTLPAPVREVTLLRFFTASSSYRQIAEVCAVSEHTVRSRLREGRSALRDALVRTASAAHTNDGSLHTASWRHAESLLAAGVRGNLGAVLKDQFHPGAAVTLAGSLTGDLGVLVPMMDHTFGAGVQASLRSVTASRDIGVWEFDFVNPADDLDHCPPGMVWLASRRDERIERLRLAYRWTPLS